MASSIKPLLVSLILIGVFAVAIISFGIMVADLNDANQSIADDQGISKFAGNLNNSLGTASSDVSSSQKALEDSPTTLSSGLYILDAIGGMWKTLINLPITIYSLTIGLLFTRILGDQSYAIVTGAFAAILGIIAIVAIWKWVSTGEGG